MLPRAVYKSQGEFFSQSLKGHGLLLQLCCAVADLLGQPQQIGTGVTLLVDHHDLAGCVFNLSAQLLHLQKQMCIRDRNIDIVKIICAALGKPESLITHVTDRKGHDMRYAIDPTFIHNELGWLPETKFKDGIQKTIQWYLDNKSWWENIISGEYQNYFQKMYGEMCIRDRAMISLQAYTAIDAIRLARHRL